MLSPTFKIPLLFGDKKAAKIRAQGERNSFCLSVLDDWMHPKIKWDEKIENDSERSHSHHSDNSQ